MDRIVKSIEVKNYKAFKEGTLYLDPFSLLIGTNSSGKSSLLKLILMLSQSSDKNNKNFVVPYGSLTDLGENKNIFFNHDIKKTLSLKFNLRDLDLEEFKFELRRSIINSLNVITRTSVSKIFDLESSNNLNSLRKELSEISSQLRGNFYYQDKINLESFKSIAFKLKRAHKVIIKAWEDEYTEEVNIEEQSLNEERGLYFNDDDLSSVDSINNIIDALKILNEFEKITKVSSIEFKIRNLKDSLYVTDCNVNFNEGLINLKTWNERTKRSSISVTSDVIDTNLLKKRFSHIKKHLKIQGMSILWRESTWNFSQVRLRKNIYSDGGAFLFCSFFQHVAQRINREFNLSQIHHVSPLRFNPERYFLMDKRTDSSESLSSNGKKILSILDSRPSIRDEINLWLKKFDLEVNTDDITHIIQSIKITDNGLMLDITDVGFGISQILPVILISVIAKPGQLTVIEQPEIHIHPKMQSELADFFISQIVDKNKYFLIETHSEALLKRLRRRMAEFNSDESQGISNEQVSIHYVNKRDNKKSGSHLKKIEISKSGAFEWPKDFNDNDIEDTIVFMQHQG